MFFFCNLCWVVIVTLLVNFKIIYCKIVTLEVSIIICSSKKHLQWSVYYYYCSFDNDWTKKLCVKGSAVCVKQWLFMIALKRLSIQLISFTDTSSLILCQWHVFLSFLYTSDSEHVPISSYLFLLACSVFMGWWWRGPFWKWSSICCQIIFLGPLSSLISYTCHIHMATFHEFAFFTLYLCPWYFIYAITLSFLFLLSAGGWICYVISCYRSDSMDLCFMSHSFLQTRVFFLRRVWSFFLAIIVVPVLWTNMVLRQPMN